MKKWKTIKDETQERRQTGKEKGEVDSELKKTRIEIPGLY
jgi:hypothetical protein